MDDEYERRARALLEEWGIAPDVVRRLVEGMRDAPPPRFGSYLLDYLIGRSLRE